MTGDFKREKQRIGGVAGDRKREQEERKETDFLGLKTTIISVSNGGEKDTMQTYAHNF